MSKTYLIVEVDELDSVDEWRAAARLAARQRGWQVRTGFGQTGAQVFVVRVDPEANNGGRACLDDVESSRARLVRVR